MSLASTSRSGIELRWWLEKLIKVRHSKGSHTGFAFAAKGRVDIATADMNSMFVHYLERVQQEPPAPDTNPLISEDDNVLKLYGFDCTLRKTTETRAKAAGLGTDVENVMNRWRVEEKAVRTSSTEKHSSMCYQYSNARDLMPVTWRYSYCQ